MKRKILQLCPYEDKIFALADDGSWWRLLGDPLSASWSRMPDLPQPSGHQEPELEFKPKVRIPVTK